MEFKDFSRIFGFQGLFKDLLQNSRAFQDCANPVDIEQGFPGPLANGLRLQRVVRGIKRCQGSSSSSRLSITDDLMLLIWWSLDLRLPHHLMFWAACSLGYFGFLRVSEFTVPNLASFSPSIHLGVQDIAVDSLSAPSCMRFKIKSSKTDFLATASASVLPLWRLATEFQIT